MRGGEEEGGEGRRGKGGGKGKERGGREISYKNSPSGPPKHQ